MTNLVLDAGALMALKRRDRRMLALLHELIGARVAAHVPAGAWRRSGAVLPGSTPSFVDESLAYRLGLLLAATGTADIVDAQGALLGASLSALVISSDPEELRRLDKSLNIVEV